MKEPGIGDFAECIDGHLGIVTAATGTEQARNKRTQRANRTGYNGVHYEADRRKYRALIHVDSRRIDLGRYDTAEEAAGARRKGEVKYWGGSAAAVLPNISGDY